MPSVYEGARDAYREPTFWRAVDNACAPHFHSAMELAYLESGEMEAVVGGKAVEARKGDLVVVPAYAVHRFATPRASVNLVLVIPPDYISSFEKLMAGKQFARPVLREGPACREILHCLRRLLRHPGANGEMWPAGLSDSYLVRGQVYTILGILLEQIPLEEVSADEGHTLVREILRYLQGNYRQPLTQEALCQAFGYSRSRISHVFNKEVGCSIPEYVSTLRSRAAASMLLEENTSVTETAMEAGFESMRSFYRAFRRCFGVTPSQFVKLARAQVQPPAYTNILYG